MYKNQEEGTLSKLERQCLEDSIKWFGDQAAHRSISHMALALAGETGEFCNLVKKIDRGSLNFGDAHVKFDLAMELTDVFVYLLNLAGMMGIDLEKTYEIKRAENDKRFTIERTNRVGVE